MSATVPDFDAITAPTPTRESLAERCAAIETGLHTQAGRAAAYAEWDGLRREYDTWDALVTMATSGQLFTDALDTLERAQALGGAIGHKHVGDEDPDRGLGIRARGAQRLHRC